MRLNFKQRFFSWLDSCGIYGGNGNTVFTAEGKLGWGHCLHAKDANGTRIGALEGRIFAFLPQFEIYINGNYIGCIKKEFTLFKPQFTIGCNGWQVDGQWMEWDCAIYGWRAVRGYGF